MKIYNIEFQYGLFLAPLSGYTDWPFRLMCRKFGAELAYTGLISATGLIRKTRDTIELTKRPKEDSPLIAQIFSASPNESAKAAKMLEDMGYDGIDINMGCPMKKVTAKGCGSALMNDENLAYEVTNKIVNAVRIPVSVKMRSGWDASSITAPQLAKRLSETGINNVIIHPRTRSQVYGGLPDWDVFESVRKNVALPLIASGNIKDSGDINRLSAIGADAFMIGRSAINGPWIFSELRGEPQPSMEEKKDAVLMHLDYTCSMLGVAAGIKYMRKFLTGYVRGMKHAAEFRRKLNNIDSYLVAEQEIRKIFVNSLN